MRGSACWPVPTTAWLLVLCVVLALPTHLAASPVKGYLLYPRELRITGENCSLPERVEVTLAIRAATLKLDLVRTGDLDPRAPIYSVLSSSVGGSVLQPLVLRNRTRYAAYLDTTLPAAVLLACAETRHGIIRMEGSVTRLGRVYRLRHIREGPRQQPWRGQLSRWLPVRLTPLHLGLPYTTDYKHTRRNRGRTYFISGDQEGSRDDEEGNAPPPRDQYHVDVLAVVDHAVFARFFSHSGRTPYADRVVDAVRKIVWNFALVFNEVNLRFQLMTTLPYKINVRLIGYVISETALGSAWMQEELGEDGETSNGYLDADTTLEQFVAWVAGTDSLPWHDHAMLFSGYDLYRTDKDNNKKLHTTGLAYVGRACTLGGESVSIIEEVGGYMIDWTVAHELAHSLGARHDGDGNWCNSKERYVMSTGEHPVTSRNQGNYWRFSPCSVEDLHQFISETRRHAWGAVCLDLARPLETAGEGEEEGSRPRGQRLGPDQQCRQLYGPKSRLLQRPLQGEAANVCSALPCLDPQRSSGSHLYFHRHLAARGTSCGNKKWCINGECVSSEDAPVRLENCVFGEEAGAVVYGRECWDYVSRSPDVCYQSLVASRCCLSCAEVLTGIPDCEYGDRITCLPSKCGQGLTLQDGTPYDRSCCQTCHQAHSSTVPSFSTDDITTASSTPGARPDFAAKRKSVFDALSDDRIGSDDGSRSDSKDPNQVPVTTVSWTTSTGKSRSWPDGSWSDFKDPNQVPVTTVSWTTSTEKSRSRPDGSWSDFKDPNQAPVTTVSWTTSTGRSRSRPDYTHRSAPAPTYTGPVTPTSATSANKTQSTPTSTTPHPVPDQDGCQDQNPPGDPPCPSLHHPETWHRCYDAKVAASCCSSCSGLANPDHSGCEYGDLRPVDCVLEARSVAACRKLTAICCHTCSHMTGSVSGSRENVASTALATALVAVILLCIRAVQ